MSKEEIEEIAFEAANAGVIGYRFGENGREPITGYRLKLSMVCSTRHSICPNG